MQSINNLHIPILNLFIFLIITKHNIKGIQLNYFLKSNYN